LDDPLEVAGDDRFAVGVKSDTQDRFGMFVEFVQLRPSSADQTRTLRSLPTVAISLPSALTARD